MGDMMTISARIPASQVEEIDEIAKRRGVDRSAVIRELIAIGLREMRLREVLEEVRERRISVWMAARKLGVTYREMLDLLKRHNVPFPLSAEDLRKELEEIGRG